MAEIRQERQALYQAIKPLRENGLSFAEIGDQLGVSRQRASEVFGDPDLSKRHKRTLRYKGVCPRCGAPTSPLRYPDDPERMCLSCRRQNNPALKWTKERVLEAIRLFEKENGRRPVSQEWLTYKESPRDYRYPNTNTVIERFGSWANAIEAAGFERPYIGIKIKNRKHPKLEPKDELVELVKKLSPWGVAPPTTHPRVRTLYRKVMNEGVTWKEICESAGARPRGERPYW